MLSGCAESDLVRGQRVSVRRAWQAHGMQNMASENRVGRKCGDDWCRLHSAHGRWLETRHSFVAVLQTKP